MDSDVRTYIIHDSVCIRTNRPCKISLKMTHPTHPIKVRAALISWAQQKVQVLWSLPFICWQFPTLPLLSVRHFPLLPNSLHTVCVLLTPCLGERCTYTSNSITLHHNSPSSACPCTGHGTSSSAHLLPLAWYRTLPSVCCATLHARNGPKNLLVREEAQSAACEQSSMSCQVAACI